MSGYYYSFCALNLMVLLSTLIGSSCAWLSRDKMMEEEEGRDYFIYLKNIREGEVKATVASTRFNTQNMPVFGIGNDQELIWEVKFVRGDIVACTLCWRGADGKWRYKQFTLLTDGFLRHPKFKKGEPNHQYFSWTLKGDGLYVENTAPNEDDVKYDLDGAIIVTSCENMVLTFPRT